MFLKGSRYEKARRYIFPTGVTAFAGVRPRDIGPAEGVLEHTLRSWDRLDLLAVHYYDDARKWWRIVDANPDILFAGRLHDESLAGKRILIPGANT